MIDVSIIIINYNTCKLTSECIVSIIQNTKGIEYEIIVVDNASTDESKDTFEKDTRISYIYLKNNLGFGAANNIGTEIATGKYLFFLNSDTLLRNNAISYFVNYIKDNSTIGALGGYLLDKYYKPTHSYGSFISIGSELRNTIYKYLDKLHLGKKECYYNNDFAIDVDYITGADLFMSKTIFEKVGGFDTNFFMYCEEVDLQDRIKDLGLKRVIIPGPQIIHYEGASDRNERKIWSTKKYHNILVSKNYYIYKRNNKFKTLFFYIINTILLFPGIILRPVNFKNKIQIIKGALGISKPIIK